MHMLTFMLLTGIVGKGVAVMCAQCDSDIDPHCAERPPAPTNCTLCTMFDTQTGLCVGHSETNFCIIERRYINESMVRITRDCSPGSMPNTCEHITQYGTPMKVCFTTCRGTGCNSCDRHVSSWTVVILMVVLCLFVYSKH